MHNLQTAPKQSADIYCFVQAKFHYTEIVKSDSKFNSHNNCTEFYE